MTATKMTYNITSIMPDFFPEWHFMKGKRAFILLNGRLYVSPRTYQEIIRCNLKEIKFCLMEDHEFENFMDRLHG